MSENNVLRFEDGEWAGGKRVDVYRGGIYLGSVLQSTESVRGGEAWVVQPCGDRAFVVNDEASGIAVLAVVRS